MNKIEKYLINEKKDIFDQIKALEKESKNFISDMKMMRTKYGFGEIPGILQPFIDEHIRKLREIQSGRF